MRGLEKAGKGKELGPFVQITIGKTSLRNVQARLMGIAHQLARHPNAQGYLVLSDPKITDSRIESEARNALEVLIPSIANRITICTEKDGRLRGIQHSIAIDTKRFLLEELQEVRIKKPPLINRVDAEFVVFKVLFHEWLTDGRPVTTDWIVRTSGYSYPTVANVLRQFGGALERTSDRKVRFVRFPHAEYRRVIAISDRARATARYGDASGQPRAPEKHLKRLEMLRVPGIAIGGVFGAKHYFEGLDIVGSPRLDISFHARNNSADADFINKLDPALRRITDPYEPASVVVHNVFHADPLFEDGASGLKWADQVECLLDLHEAGLEMQASQFLNALRRRRPTTS